MLIERMDEQVKQLTRAYREELQEIEVRGAHVRGRHCWGLVCVCVRACVRDWRWRVASCIAFRT